MPFGFEVLARATTSAARRGRLTTAHGVVDTPVFMPVGTQGAVKGLDPRDLSELGARIVLANAYHLMLRPTSKLVAALGGLHRFCAWPGAILTDSGGYQVFSLADLREVTDHGVIFRSHLDGALVELTPESLVRVQEELAPDIAMVLDECPPGAASREVVARAVERTTRWAERALAAQERGEVAWFGIVQGGVHEDLRVAHAQALAALPFKGFAIGGVSVGESPADIERVVRVTAPHLPADQPRYLMGVGTPADLVRAVAAGVDMFDCVLPTRNARNGELFTATGKLHIKNATHRDKSEPVDASCACYVCRTFSRAYLRHLFVASELSYHRLATWHNLAFYLGLMERIRGDIEQNCFDPGEHLRRLAPVA